MDLREAIYTRRAVREFTAEPVDDKTFRQLIDAAIQAPSAVNQQPWSFCVVRDQALLAYISSEAKTHMLQNLARRSIAPFSGTAEQSDLPYFLSAPALILISSAAESPWAVENCSLAAENLMLAARAAGLGTCWIGFAQSWLVTPEGKAALKLPANYMPVAPIIVGHPKSAPPPVPRKEPEIHWIDA